MTGVRLWATTVRGAARLCARDPGRRLSLLAGGQVGCTHSGKLVLDDGVLRPYGSE